MGEILGCCFLAVFGFFALALYFSLWIAHPVLAAFLTGAIIFIIYLVKEHRQKMRKQAAELKTRKEGEKIKEREKYMTDYFDKRKRSLKQFDHLNDAPLASAATNEKKVERPANHSLSPSLNRLEKIPDTSEKRPTQNESDDTLRIIIEIEIR